MDEPIDVAFVDKDGVVLQSFEAVSPWKRLRCKGAYYTLERWSKREVDGERLFDGKEGDEESANGPASDPWGANKQVGNRKGDGRRELHGPVVLREEWFIPGQRLILCGRFAEGENASKKDGAVLGGKRYEHERD